MLDTATNYYEFDQYGLCTQPEESVDIFVSVHLNHNDEVPIHQKTVFSNVDNNEQVIDSVMKECKTISEKLSVHPLVAFMLLEEQSWNSHLVYENWASNQVSMLGNLGIQLINSNEDPSLRRPNVPLDQELECDTCYGMFQAKEMWCLPCGHTYCEECWQRHVTARVASGQHLINCQSADCKRKLPPNSVEMLCGKKVYNDFLRYLMDRTVSLADTLTNCPSPTCSRPVNVLSTGLCNALKCESCGFEFCSLCRNQSHAPATCVEKTFWENATGDELMKKRLLGPNVKLCPNCHSTIEKNGGCNHMTCWNCHHEFCWMCGKPWKTHKQNFYQCDDYREEDDPYLKKPDNISKDLLQPFHDKFIQKQSQNKAFFDKIDENTKVIMLKVNHEVGLSDAEIKKVITSFMREVFWARENLRWSHVHMFYVRFQVVKDFPTEEQTDEKKHPNSPDYNIFRFALKEAEEIIDKSLNHVMTTGKIMLHDIEKLTRQVHLVRQSLLKHCDPHYSNI